MTEQWLYDGRPIPERQIAWRLLRARKIVAGPAFFARPRAEIEPMLAAVGVTWGDYTPPEPVAPTRWPVLRSTILKRAEAYYGDAAVDTAFAALEANRPAWRRWVSSVEIYSDDAEVRAFLAAVGFDADALLARGEEIDPDVAP